MSLQAEIRRNSHNLLRKKNKSRKDEKGINSRPVRVGLLAFGKVRGFWDEDSG